MGLNNPEHMRSFLRVRPYPSPAFPSLSRKCPVPPLIPVFIVAGLLAATLPAAAQEQSWEYRNWRAVAETIDTGEDIRITCSAQAGGDGLPVVQATLSNGDVLPPDAFPSVTVEEHAPRGYATMMQEGDAVNFLFDDGDSAPANVYVWADDEGFAVASAEIASSDSQRVLQAMRRAGQLEVVRSGEVVATVLLDGFSAAYGKMAEACGFSTEGVLD